MNREWMGKSRLSSEYEAGVEEFIKFALDHGADPTRIICPCVDCSYVKRVSVEEVRDHLFIFGINQDYTRWIWHGEKVNSDQLGHDTDKFETLDKLDGDRIDDLLHDVENCFEGRRDMFADINTDAHKPLYSGCTKFTKLSATLKLYNLKARHGWTDKSFTSLLELLVEMLPETNCLPDRTYAAKKMLRSLGMDYQKIHGMRYEHCEYAILWWTECMVQGIYIQNCEFAS